MQHFQSEFGQKKKHHWRERQIIVNLFVLNLVICLFQLYCDVLRQYCLFVKNILAVQRDSYIGMNYFVKGDPVDEKKNGFLTNKLHKTGEIWFDGFYF